VDLVEQSQQKLANGLQGQESSAGDGDPSSDQPGVAPPPEPASPQEPSSLPVPSANPPSPSGGGVEPPAPGAAPATASRRTSSRSFRQHRAMRALRAHSGGSSGSGGASTGGPNSRSSSRSTSRSQSRASLVMREPPAAAGVTQSASAQRQAARSIEQSLDPLLRARVEELAEQAVAARLRRRLSSGDTLSPVLTDEEILAADVAGIFRGGGGTGLESQRCALEPVANQACLGIPTREIDCADLDP